MEWVMSLFQSIDSKDIEKFSSYLADDVLFRFGNADPVSGKKAVNETVKGFFESVKGLSHEIAGTWQQQDTVICHGSVTYTRHDSSTLTVPFANIFRMREDKIAEYLIFVDVSRLYDTG